MVREELRAVGEYLGITNVHYSCLPDERLDGLSLIDVIRPIEDVVEEEDPDLVLIHHPEDTDQDHRVVTAASIVACREIGKVLYFEVPGPTTMGKFEANYFYPLTGEQMNKKLDAMEHYKSEVRPWPSPRSRWGIGDLARLRGCRVGVEYAEAYQVLRWLVA